MLSEDFVGQFRGKQPAWGPLGYVVYKRTYSYQGNEEWWDTCERVINAIRVVAEEAGVYRSDYFYEDMYESMFAFKWLPPGRGLDKLGTPAHYEKGGAVLNNCGFVSTKEIRQDDLADPFCWLMDMSMLGVGVGIDTRGAGEAVIVEPFVGGVHVVSDTREGWIELIRTVLNAYVGACPLPTEVDYSRLRPAGALLNTMGGVSSGPGPLRDLYRNLNNLLSKHVGRPVSEELITDIANYIGVCVVSGGIRRTAEIVLGTPSAAFVGLKSDEAALASHRWTSNNSILLATYGDHLAVDWLNVAENILTAGEPGVLWLDTARGFGRLADGPNDADANADGCNPCGEQTLHHKELCCLVETFPVLCESFNDYLRVLDYAVFYATMITTVPVHDVYTNGVIAKNRRIGVSRSGEVAYLARKGWTADDYEYRTELTRAYEHIRRINNTLSIQADIPPSIKVTSIKPSGTVSKLPGVTEGCGYPEDNYYIQRIRMPMNNPLVKAAAEAGFIVEEAVNEPNTMVIAFPVYVEGDTRKTVTWKQQADLVATLQRFWADNQVSCTITLPKGLSAHELANFLLESHGRFKSLSFLPYFDEGSNPHPQMPRESITLAQFLALRSRCDYSKLVASGAGSRDQVDKFCDGESCSL